MRTIKIFLASSAELKEDRLAFENFIGRENNILQQKEIFLHLDIWEDFIDAISQTRLQDEYNKKIKKADIFIMLFFTKVGMYTSEEFDKALKQFKKANKPLIYTYFKNAHIKFGDLKREEANSVWDFEDKLKKLGHFKTNYEYSAELHLHFRHQLDKLLVANHFQLPYSEKQIKLLTNQIPHCLSAGQSSVPPNFIGREIELATIKQKLEKNKLLLVHAEGGMGKTTLAAKYLADNVSRYEHFAWLFCDAGINEQIKTLASALKVDLTNYKEDDDQLLALKTAMQNLGNDCLLILDNANETNHIDDFGRKFGGLPWHVLLTSRCQNILPIENEITLQHLGIGEAKTLFKKYQNENTPDFDALLDRFLKAIGYNTLMIELFSKNLHELSALGKTLEDALQQLEEKGIFLGERSFEIRTAWTDNVHKTAATTDQIIETLYDLTKLTEPERQLLVNLALLPAENHLLTLLVEILTTADKIAFAKQLKALAQKGWLASDTKAYRMNPVVQQIILAKNKETAAVDAENLVSNLSNKLTNDGYFLVNLRSYAQAQPFVELAESVTRFLKDERFDIALLLFNLSDYYRNVGNHKKGLEQLNKAAEIFKEVDKGNYGVCLQRLGVFYQSQGNLEKALGFFEQDNELRKELFEANPMSETIKNGLAISYQRLGIIYETQGNLEKALDFFEQYNELETELFEANPQDETIKHNLAISYSRLGIIYETQGNLEKALAFFEQYNILAKELFGANPQGETIKNNLAISYQRLGIIYEKQGNLEKALGFFEQYNILEKELFEANPRSENIKNNLAISYSRLGNIYEKQGNLEKAMVFFEQDINLGIELFEANPQSETIKNGLAVSYQKLGIIYEKQGNLEKALGFFEQYNILEKELFEANPRSENIKNNLAISYSRLGNIYEKQGNLEKAMVFFEQDINLGIELFEANPQSETIKNGLAVSYHKLGHIYEKQNDLEKALAFFEQDYLLKKELFEANPQSVEIYNGLAVSNERLGLIYKKMQQPEKAKDYLQKAAAMYLELTEKVPEAVEYKRNLEDAQEELKDL